MLYFNVFSFIFNCDLCKIFDQDFSVLRLRGALPLQEAPNLAVIMVCGKWYSSDPQQADL
jgi:hypothetical protein